MFIYLYPYYLLPQPHVHTTLRYRDNYCSNVDHTPGAPGCMEDRPWFYTSDVNVREYCTIPNCGKLFAVKEIKKLGKKYTR